MGWEGGEGDRGVGIALIAFSTSALRGDVSPDGIPRAVRALPSARVDRKSSPGLLRGRLRGIFDLQVLGGCEAPKGIGGSRFVVGDGEGEVV